MIASIKYFESVTAVYGSLLPENVVTALWAMLNIFMLKLTSYMHIRWSGAIKHHGTGKLLKNFFFAKSVVHSYRNMKQIANYYSILLFCVL